MKRLALCICLLTAILIAALIGCQKEEAATSRREITYDASETITKNMVDAMIAIANNVTGSTVSPNQQSYSLAAASKADRVMTGYSATGASTIHLMDDLIYDGREFLIVDAGGAANSANIVLDTEGSSTINGAATYTINTAYAQTRCISNGTNWFCK